MQYLTILFIIATTNYDGEYKDTSLETRQNVCR